MLGLTFQQIGEYLCISPEDLNQSLLQLNGKLKVKDTTEMMELIYKVQMEQDESYLRRHNRLHKS